jgi:hypothetical protein
VDASSRQSVRREGAVLRGLRGGDRAPAVIAVSPSIAAAPDAQVLANSAPGSRSTPRVTSRRAGAHHRQAAQGPTNKGGTGAETPLSQSRSAAYVLSEDGESKNHLARRGPARFRAAGCLRAEDRCPSTRHPCGGCRVGRHDFHGFLSPGHNSVSVDPPQRGSK